VVEGSRFLAAPPSFPREIAGHRWVELTGSGAELAGKVAAADMGDGGEDVGQVRLPSPSPSLSWLT